MEAIVGYAVHLNNEQINSQNEILTKFIYSRLNIKLIYYNTNRQNKSLKNK